NDTRLALEARRRHLVGGAVQELDRDLSREGRLLGQIHGAHATTPDQFGHPVAVREVVSGPILKGRPAFVRRLGDGRRAGSDWRGRGRRRLRRGGRRPYDAARGPRWRPRRRPSGLTDLAHVPLGRELDRARADGRRGGVLATLGRVV